MPVKDNFSYSVVELDAACMHLTRKFRYKSSIKAQKEIRQLLEDNSVTHPIWGKVEIKCGVHSPLDSNPSVNRMVHGWIFLFGLLGELSSNQSYLNGIASYIESWVEEYLDIDDSSPLYPTVYHDETTAQRMNNAIRLHAIYKSTEYESTLLALEKLLDHTARKLFSDEFYAGRNNHGMFQAKALRDYSVYATWANSETRNKYLTTSLIRIDEYFLYCFTSEGVHIEHSPSYHLMIVRHVYEHAQFLEALTGNSSEILQEILENAERHSVHTIQPNGVFLPLSDSTQVSLEGAKNNVLDSPEFAYAASRGRVGEKPKNRTLSEPDSGYFFHRTAWGDENAGYLAFVAAYNGGYHKHSDDLHVYLWKYGYELLTESGPYGYQMKEPFTRYAFSQYAHNCIVVDSYSLPRHDGKYEKVTMSDPSQDELGLISIQAQNSRFRDVDHVRRVIFNDGLDHIVVRDELTSKIMHKYSLVWNFGHLLDLSVEGNTVTGHIDSQPIIKLEFSGPPILDVLRIRGRGGSRPKGWRFPKFGHKVPTNQIIVNFNASSELITTIISVFDQPRVRTTAATSEFLPPPRVHTNVNHKSSAMAAIVLEPQTVFANLERVGSTLYMRGTDLGARATVKLFRENQLISEKKGLIQSIKWGQLASGRYRVRVFPKGKDSALPAFTSSWISINNEEV